MHLYDSRELIGTKRLITNGLLGTVADLALFYSLGSWPYLFVGVGFVASIRLLAYIIRWP